MTEFDDVIRRLEEERPQASARELDEIKQRVRRRAADPSRKGNQPMKSRFAILAMLVTGMLFSTAGAGLAISGIQDNASVSQYGTPVCTPTPSGGGTNPAASPTPGSGGVGGDVCEEGGVLPAEESNPGSDDDTGGGGTAPAEETDGGTLPAEETNNTQPERQVAAAAETSQLPFTGFAAIPVLIGGLALLTGGLILRRRTS